MMKYYEVWNSKLNGYVMFKTYAACLAYCDDNHIDERTIHEVIY